MNAMDPRQRKEILGQWGVREENAREQAERETLERELEGQPYRGRRIAPRPQFFQRSPESYVASRGGPLPYMSGCVEIAAETGSRTRPGSRTAWRDLAYVHAADPAGFARSWLADRRALGLRRLNELVAKHNRFYPAESRLPDGRAAAGLRARERRGVLDQAARRRVDPGALSSGVGDRAGGGAAAFTRALAAAPSPARRAACAPSR